MRITACENFVVLATGTKVSAMKGVPTLDDMRFSAGKICRFAGNGVDYYPVILHTFVVADLCPPELRPHALLHDMGSEVVTNDIPKPVKTPQQERLEKRLLNRVYLHYGLKLLTDEQYHKLKVADRMALHGEVWTVGTVGLRPMYKERFPEVEKLIRKYQKQFPVLDCLKRDGKASREFLLRWKLYRRNS